jgi:hypothetical protein
MPDEDYKSLGGSAFKVNYLAHALIRIKQYKVMEHMTIGYKLSHTYGPLMTISKTDKRIYRKY